MYYLRVSQRISSVRTQNSELKCRMEIVQETIINITSQLSLAISGLMIGYDEQRNR